VKAKLLFSLEKVDDRMAHYRCLKSTDMALALWDIHNQINELYDTSEDGKFVRWQDINKVLECAFEKYQINLDNLIS
jgi:hypothetical protein